MQPQQGPPSTSNLPFAETAAPPTREDFERLQALRQNISSHQASPVPAAYPGAYGSPQPQQRPSGSMPSPAIGYGPTNPPPPPGNYPQATAAMPGIAQDPSLVPEGAPRILCGFLISFEGNPLGAFWPLSQGRNVIGREGAPVPLDIRIAHPTTSSRHAVLMGAALPGRLKLEDLGSTNGTFVNDARLTQGQPVELADGDRIRFGLFTTTVKIV